MINANTFICQLSIKDQYKIKELVTAYLISEGYNEDEIKESIESVMENRLWNVQDIIDITPFTNRKLEVN